MFLLLRLLYRRLSGRKAAASPASSDRTSGLRSTHGGALALVLHQARYDLRAFLRNKQGRYFTLILPIVLLVVFVSVGVGGKTVGPGHADSSTYYVPGLSALAVVAASFVNLVISLTAQREAGVLKRRRATPVPACVLIAGRTLTAIAVSLVTLTMLLAVGHFAYGIHVSAATVPDVVVTVLLGSAAFCALGYALSTRIRSADAAQPMVQAIMLPLYFISGVFVPSVDLPGWLRHVAAVFPVEHLADALRHAYAPGSGIVWSDLLALAIWAAAGLALALRRFSWTPSTATS
jgi:ABC-2 type transport system permease protein